LRTLELLYYVAGIAIAVFAYKGLEQLTIAKQTAVNSATPESFKLAAEQCRYFAEIVLPAGTAAVNAIRAQPSVATLFTAVNFTVSQGQIQKHNFSLKSLNSELPKVMDPLVDFVNKMEAFAMFFTARVADETVAYRETAIPFSEMCALAIPMIYFLRENNRGRYDSTIELLEIWHNRLRADKLTKDMVAIEANLKDV